MTRSVISLIEHMGDIIVAEPAARQLKSMGHHVTWVASPRYVELLRRNPNVDEIHIASCLSEWDAMPYESRFDNVYDMHFDDRQCESTKRFIKKRTGSSEVSLDNYLYGGRTLLQSFLDTSLFPPLTVDRAPILHLPAGPAPLPSPYIVLHCHANEAQRRWSDTNFRMLALDICSLGYKVAEIGLKPSLANTRGVVDLTGTLPLASLADVIRHASLFIGLDSGPAHMAHALNIPSLILMGKYRYFRRYDPFGQTPANFTIFNADVELPQCPYMPILSSVLHKIKETL